MVPSLTEIVELRQPLKVAAGGKDDVDLAAIGTCQRIARAGPEQARVLLRIHRDIDRAGAQIGDIEARVENAGQALVLGKPAREGDEIVERDAPAHALQHRKEAFLFQQDRARLGSGLCVDRAAQAQCKAGFLQRFADRGDLMRGFIDVDVASLTREVVIAGVDAAAGKHRHAARKGERAGANLHQDLRRAAIGRMAEDHHGCGGDAIARGILFYAASHDPLPNLLSGFLTMPLVVPNALTTACRRRAASGKTGTGGA